MRNKTLIAGVIMSVIFSTTPVFAGVPTDVAEKMEMAELYSDEEIDLIALVTLGEAEGESEMGKRLVIDTILNRVDTDIYPDNITDVCYQNGQFLCLHNGRCKRCKVTESVRSLVREELASRTNSDVLYFNTAGYGNHTPIVKEGAHYFSGR